MLSGECSRGSGSTSPGCFVGREPLKLAQPKKWYEVLPVVIGLHRGRNRVSARRERQRKRGGIGERETRRQADERSLDRRERDPPPSRCAGERGAHPLLVTAVRDESTI